MTAYDQRKTYFTCDRCGCYLTPTEAAKSPTCAGCRAQAQRAADRPSTCAVGGCQQPPTQLQVGPPTRWICPAHAAAELAEARAAAALPKARQ